MFTKEDFKKIHSFIYSKFNIIYDYKFNGTLFLLSDSIQKILLNRNISTLYFTLLTQDDENIKNFLKSNKISYNFNHENKCYSFTYNNSKIEISYTRDLSYLGSLNTDKIYYDVHRNDIVTMGLNYMVHYNVVLAYRYDKNDTKERINQAKDFILYLKNVKKRIKFKRLYNIFTKKSLWDSYDNMTVGNIYNEELKVKIDNLIKEKCNILYDSKFNGRIFLLGGAIRNLILNKKVKDLDFNILTDEVDECEKDIASFIKSNNLNYAYNIFGGYKFLYNDMEVDIFAINDFAESAKYSIDGAAYDINNREFLIQGTINSLQSRKILRVKNLIKKNENFIDANRRRKLINFTKTITNSNKRVLIKKDNFKELVLLFKIMVKKIKRIPTIISNRLEVGVYNNSFCFLKNKRKYNFIHSILTVFTPLLFILSMIQILGYLGNLNSINLNKGFGITAAIIITIICCLAINKISLKIKSHVKEHMTDNIKQHIMKIYDYIVLNCPNESYDNIRNAHLVIPSFFFIIKTLNIYSILVILFLGCVNLINNKIGLLLLLFMIGVFLFQRMYIKMIIRITRNSNDNHIEYNDLLREVTFRTNANKHLIKETNISLNDKDYIIDNKQIYLFNILSFVVKIIGTILLIVYASYLFKQGIINNLLFIISLLSIYLIWIFLDWAITLRYCRAELSLYSKCLFGIKKTPLTDKHSIRNYSGKIEFSNVDFKYNNKKYYSFRNCSFLIKPKEIVAVVSHDLSGPYELLNTLVGFEKASYGIININNQNIENYSYELLLKQFSIVSSNPYLFDISIKDYLKMNIDDISDTKIKKICKELGIDSFIESLENKYDTILNDNVNLSYTLKELLSISRALLSNSKIVVICDIPVKVTKKERAQLINAIEFMKKTRTIILATNEVSLIKKCDKVIYISNSNVDVGTHRSLLKLNERYNNAFKTNKKEL